MCLLHVESQNKLRLMASITVCSSQIHCIATIPQVTPKESMNAEDYFGSSYSISEVSLSTPYLANHDNRFESTGSYGGIDSDSDMLSSECSNNNLPANDDKKLRRNTLGGSSESVQTLIGISETEEVAEDTQHLNRTSTGTLLADDVLPETSAKKKTVRKRRSSLQHEPTKSVPLPRRHLSLTAKLQQSEQYSSLQDLNRNTSVSSVGHSLLDSSKKDNNSSNLSLYTETNFSFNDESLSEPSHDKQVMCPSPDKQVLDQPRPQSPLKKFMRILSPTVPHRNISSPVAQHRVISSNPVHSSSRLNEFSRPNAASTMRPRSVSTTFLDPVSYHQRSATLGRDHSRKQFSPMTLKPAHIKEDSGQTTNSQNPKMGSSQMWLGTEDKWYGSKCFWFCG